jgi:hypothetical protein
MRPDDPAEVPLEPVAPRPAVVEQPDETLPRRRSHLVVVVTRALDASEVGDSGAVLRARYWNPHERRWSEHDYDTVESLRHRHIEEEGWELLQEQRLDAPHAVELIFKAYRVDFTRPSREQILRDIGMSPEAVDRMLDQVERRQRGDP